MKDRKDRRREIRILVRASLDVSCREFSSDHLFSTEGFIHSLSHAGISFRTRDPLPNVPFIDIEINLPLLNKVIKPSVHILWKNDEKKQYGGNFANISKGDSELLKRYIEYPLSTKKISLDRRLRNDPSNIPGGKERRKKNT